MSARPGPDPRVENTPESYAAACEQIEDAIERERDEREDARWDW